MLDDEMLTIEELAAYLKLRPQTIYRWAQRGTLPGAKLGKEWRFRRSAIERWIDGQTQGCGRAKGASGSEAQGPAVERRASRRRGRGGRARRDALDPESVARQVSGGASSDGRLEASRGTRTGGSEERRAEERGAGGRRSGRKVRSKTARPPGGPEAD